jgi:hypothetical protein
VRLRGSRMSTHIHTHTTALEQRRLSWVPGWDVRDIGASARAANVVLTDGDTDASFMRANVAANRHTTGKVRMRWRVLELFVSTTGMG